MIPFYLFLLACYLYYTRSKYCPANLFRPATFPGWAIPIILITGIAVNIFQQGWVRGFLVSLVACSLAVILIQFTAVLGKKYFYSMVIFVHCLVIFDLLN